MPISPLNGQDRLRAAAAAAALRANTAPGVASATRVGRHPDVVSISDAARSLSAAHKAVAAAPEIREDRVSALKAALADGTYSVDSRTLAANILQNSD